MNQRAHCAMKALVAAAFLLCVGGALATNPGGLFRQGNEAYEQGNMTQAQEAYEAVVKQRLGHASLFYNLGNAHYRLGRLGPARLWYERALREDPWDDDTRHNLSLIRAQLQENEGAWGAALRYQGPLAWTLLALNLLFFGLLILSRRQTGEWLWWTRGIVGAALLISLGLWAALRAQTRYPAGIILSPRTEVRTSPSPEAAVGFIVPEGQKVMLFDALNGWSQIGVPDKGLKGWVPDPAVEPIALP